MRVTPPALEMWLTGYVRDLAATEGKSVSVSNKEPDTLRVPLAKPLIVIRDDSGSRLGWTTFDRSIGATVLAGTRQNDKPADDLAQWLAAVLMDDAIILAPGSPITSIEWDGCNGPYAVSEPVDLARRYSTIQYVVTGSW